MRGVCLRVYNTDANAWSHVRGPMFLKASDDCCTSSTPNVGFDKYHNMILVGSL